MRNDRTITIALVTYSIARGCNYIPTHKLFALKNLAYIFLVIVFFLFINK